MDWASGRVVGEKKWKGPKVQPSYKLKDTCRIGERGLCFNDLGAPMKLMMFSVYPGKMENIFRQPMPLYKGIEYHLRSTRKRNHKQRSQPIWGHSFHVQTPRKENQWNPSSESIHPHILQMAEAMSVKNGDSRWEARTIPLPLVSVTLGLEGWQRSRTLPRG